MFSIRAAQGEDYEQAIAIMSEADELHRVHVPWLFQAPASEPRPREFFAELLADVDSRLLVADAGSLIGVANVRMRSTPDFGVFIAQRFGILDNIAIGSAWRRRGVGTALTHAAERWAQARGAVWLELGVYEFNAGARSFYETLGYLPVSSKLRKPLLSAETG